MKDVNVEFNFCRRCGNKLIQQKDASYKCEAGHTIFFDIPTSACAILFCRDNSILVIERAVEPGKGTFSFPGGFCDKDERVEVALQREIMEEVGIAPDQYEPFDFVCSDIDIYPYGGEVFPTRNIILKAQLVDKVQFQAGGDAGRVFYIQPADVDPKTIYFSSIRLGLQKFKADLP